MPTAKLFTHGGSQALRLPKEFRFDCAEVYIRRVGEDLVVSRKPVADVESMIAALHLFEPGAVFERDQPAMQERVELLPSTAAVAARKVSNTARAFAPAPLARRTGKAL